MSIGSNFIAIFAISVGFVITITAILADTISKYKLKKEQIKADAMVRAEEIRAKNQLELEKLMRRDLENDAFAADYNSEPVQFHGEEQKRKSRIRE